MKSDRQGYVWVGIQVFLFAVLFFVPRDPIHWIGSGSFPLLQIAGIMLGSLGAYVAVHSAFRLGSGFTPSPSPHPAGVLRTTGFYRYVRHPLYSGLLCIALGYAVYEHGILKLLFVHPIYLFFKAKAMYEEALLKQRFAEYEAYAKVTPRLFPRFLSFFR